jgi:hypothetical protein
MANDRDVKSGPNPRQLAFGGALACTLAVAAAYAVGTSENPIASSAVLNPSGAAQDVARGSTGRLPADTRFVADRNWSDKLRRAPIELEPGGSLMGSKSWTPPPPVVTAAPTPTVPPFPFQYMGKLVFDDGATIVYLTKGEEIFTAKTGEVIAGSYRVDTVGTDFIEVTYLPLDKKQNVTFSSILPPVRTDGIAMGGRGVAPVTLAQATAPSSGSSTGHSHAVGTSASPAPAQSGGLAVTPVADATGLPATGGSVPVSGARGGGQSTTATTTGSGGGMVIAPPTISQMPMSPPTISQMPILPPPSGSMPMFAPTPGATVPGMSASGTLSTTPAPSQ